MTGSRAKSILTILTIFLHIAASCNAFPLSTKGKFIYNDATGERVKLAGVNWAGHLEAMIPEGLDKQPLAYIAKQIVAAGFNSVRLTWATWMYTRSEYGHLTVSQSLDKYGLKDAKAGVAKNNPQLLNKKVIDVQKVVVDELGKNKIMVILDNHISVPTWCCSKKDDSGFFGDKFFDTKEWIAGLTAVAKAYRGNQAMVGIGMRNELRGPRANPEGWLRYMPKGAHAIHRSNPDILILAGGLNFAVDLSFLRSRPHNINVGDKLVFEAHWYSFAETESPVKWEEQPNRYCAFDWDLFMNNSVFLTHGRNPVPVMMSEFGKNQESTNVADNFYVNCVSKFLAETDMDWALWGLQGSYMYREGTLDLDEQYGIMNHTWNGFRSPNFVRRLGFIQHVHQVPNKEYYDILFHPESGLCGQVNNDKLFLADCSRASKWAQTVDAKGRRRLNLLGTGACLAMAGNGLPATISHNCSTDWVDASEANLQLATMDRNQMKNFCLEYNAKDSTVVTKKCLCLTGNLRDVTPCKNNPQAQWFKFVPANI